MNKQKEMIADNVVNIIALCESSVIASRHDYVVVEKFLYKSDRILGHQTVPLYENEVLAGIASSNADDCSPEDFVYTVDTPHCDGGLRVKGNSMQPKLQPGDIVLYKETKSRRANLFFGNMYIVSYIEDGDQYLVVKCLEESDEPECYKLVSYNDDYAPKKIPKDSIIFLAQVIASGRMYMNF